MYRNIITVLVISILSLFVGLGILLAVDISSARYLSLLGIQNTDVDATNLAANFPLSGQALSDNNFIDPDTLNSIVVDSNSDEVKSQPPSLRQSMDGAVADDGGVLTTQTTGSNNATINDVTLLPSVPVVNDAYYFAGDHRFRIITLNISTAGNGTWALTWEYYNGTVWTALSNVSDGTSSFETSGTRTVSFNMPDDWAVTNVNAINDKYWVRARVSSFTSISIQPKARQLWWETGVWWVYVDSIDADEQVVYTLAYGGTTDLVTSHQFFPGVEGYTTDDAAAIELDQNYRVSMEGCFIVDGSIATSSYLDKLDAIRIYNPSSGVVSVDINNGGLALSVSGVTPGCYTMSVVDDGVFVSLSVGSFGSDASASLPVVDNANDWVWGFDGQTILFDEIQVSFPLTRAEVYEGQLSTGSWSNTRMRTSNPGDATISSVALGTTTTGAGIYIDSGTVLRTVSAGQIITRDYTGAQTATCTVTGASTLSGITFDGTYYWVASDGNNTIYQVDGACVIQASWASPDTSVEGITWDGTYLWIIGRASNIPTVYKVSTAGATQFSYVIDAMVDQSGAETESIIPQDISWDDVTGTVWVTGIIQADSSNELDSRDSVFVNLTSDASGDTNFFWTFPSLHEADDFFSPAGLFFDGVLNQFWVLDNMPTIDKIYRLDGAVVVDGIIYLKRKGFNWKSNPQDVVGDPCTNAPGGTEQPFGWTMNFGTSPSCGTVSTIQEDTGSYSYAIESLTTTGLVDISQQLTASAGQVWSFSVMVRNDSCLGTQTFKVEFRLVSSVLSTTSDTTCSDAAWVEVDIDNLTAPATTDNVLLTYTLGRNFTGNQASVYIDSTMAALNTSSPAYPDASNLLVNPGFENIYHTSGSRTSAAYNVGSITNVLTSSISWDEYEPTGTTVLVETSINGGGLYSTATNGGSIPGIDLGDDLTGISILARTSLSTSDQTVSSEFSNFNMVVIDDSGVALWYSPQEFIGESIDDRSVSNLNATTSFPNGLSSLYLISVSSPLYTSSIPTAGPASGSLPIFTPDPLDLGLSQTPGIIPTPVVDPDFPFKGFVDWASSSTFYPSGWIWGTIIFLVALLIASQLVIFTESVFISMIAFMFVLGIGYGFSLITLWPLVIAFMVMSLTWIIKERVG